MGLLSAFFAAFFAAASNLFMRRSMDAGGTARAYLLIQMSVSTLIAIFVGPITENNYRINGPIAVFGAILGVLLAFLLIMLGKALEKGPPGLTFSILSGATVVPGVFMAAVFGAAFGFVYTAWHGIGSVLVLAGLFWAGRGLQGLQDRNRWILFSGAMFLTHVLILILYQWRALLLNHPRPEEVASFFTSEQIHSHWFMPMMYLSAAIVQAVVYLRNEQRLPYRKEWVNGIIGGVTNGLCTFFLLKSTELATSLEQAIIYPMFSIGTIILSNLWSQRLYQERVNWRAAQVCALGLLIGTVNWKAFMAAIGF